MKLFLPARVHLNRRTCRHRKWIRVCAIYTGIYCSNACPDENASLLSIYIKKNTKISSQFPCNKIQIGKHIAIPCMSHAQMFMTKPCWTLWYIRCFFPFVWSNIKHKHRKHLILMFCGLRHGCVFYHISIAACTDSLGETVSRHNFGTNIIAF